MPRKAAVSMLIVLVLLHSLAGCAGMTEGQKGAAVGTGVGTGVGALIGSVVGGKKGAVLGALAGAIVGGLAGWQVGEYRAQQIQSRPQAAAALRYEPQQGVIAKIDRTANTPDQLKPGDRIVLQTYYTVLAPADHQSVRVKEVRTIYFNNEELGHVEKESELTPGTYSTQHLLTLPTEAADGTYVVQTVVTPISPGRVSTDKATRPFVVRRVAAAPGTPAPPTAAPPASAPTLPRAVSIKIERANLRGGAGTGHPIVRTATRGERFEVLGLDGPPSDRWYRVRLAGGGEAWVAASVVTAVEGQ